MIDFEGLAKLAFIGGMALLFGLGVLSGFTVASIINLGKMCL